MSIAFEVMTSVVSAGVAALMAYNAKREFDKTDEKKEEIKVEEAIEKIRFGKIEDDNVIDLMLKNVKELREYYVISKQQARKSFSAALFICFFGVCIYLLGIISYIVFNKDIAIISVIAGTVVEVIAGLFFWLYREAIQQLNIYHERLGSTEKYLIVIQVIKELPEEQRIESFRNLTMAILTDNREIIGREKSNNKLH